MVGIGQADQFARKPPIELCLARICADEFLVDFRGHPVVLPAESPVSLEVALLE
jgi:hypothetical protein